MAMPLTWTRPSLARKAIEENFPGHAIEDIRGGWASYHIGTVRFLLEILSNVDENILFATFSPEESVRWRRQLAAMDWGVRLWQSGGQMELSFAPVVELYRLLGRCPDEIVPTAEPRLTFIADPKLRASIARDIDSLDALIRDEEWKAATVIGGSITEALLLDRLLDPANRPNARAAEKTHVDKGDEGWGSKSALDRWQLEKMIEVARELLLIDETVASVCHGARGFRNLIHPGRERAKAPCDRGTALAAVAAVENLVAKFSGTR